MTQLTLPPSANATTTTTTTETQALPTTTQPPITPASTTTTTTTIIQTATEPDGPEPWVVPVAVGVAGALGLGLLITLATLWRKKRAAARAQPLSSPPTPMSERVGEYADVTEVRDSHSAVYEPASSTLKI